MQIITESLITSGQSDNGGWGKEQLKILGVTWPPISGWKKEIIGQEISDEDLKRFIQLRNAHIK